MNGREWKPGDVALAYDDDWSFRVVRHEGSPDYWSAANGVWPRGVREDLLDYRPLVVIDFDLWPGQNSGPAAAKILRLAAEDSCGPRESLLTWLADQIDPIPPKPAEPTGLGAVVEDAEGKFYVLTQGEGDTANWSDVDGNYHWYRNIAVVKVLSEGVNP